MTFLALAHTHAIGVIGDDKKPNISTFVIHRPSRNSLPTLFAYSIEWVDCLAALLDEQSMILCP